MEIRSRVQIHQYNDSEILEFISAHGIQHRLIGDHLFIVRSRGRDVAAGPGDWLTFSSGEVEVQRGDYARRARQAMVGARRARRAQDRVSRATVGTQR